MKPMILTAIYDLKTKTYGYVQTVEHADDSKRLFHEMIQHGQNSIAKFPQDYSLYSIAEYDRTTGTITPFPPVLLAHAVDYSDKPLPNLEIRSVLKSLDLRLASLEKYIDDNNN